MSSSSPGAPSSRAAGLWARLRQPPFLLFLIIGPVIAFRLLPDEFHFNGDEMRHAVTGLFFRDLLVDFPWRNPLQYTYEYYSKYPALAVPHWPPLFHFIQGLFFLVFGISVWSSRLATLSFALLGVYYWYRIAERVGDRQRAILSSLIFPLIPYVLLYERSTMLEIPLVALCLGTIWFWLQFLEHERAAHLWACAVFVVAAFLTAQKAIFLAFFLPLHFLLERRFRLLKRWDVWLASALSIAVVVAWYLFSFQTLALSYERVAQSVVRVSHWPVLLYYLRALYIQLGLVLMILAGSGVVWAAVRAPRQHRFLLLWVFSCYLCFTYIREKDVRHTLVWIPPLVYFALLCIEGLFAHRKLALLASSSLAIYVFVGALRYDRPRITGVEDAAHFVLSLPESDIVYYHGFLNGDFIFYVRKYDPQKSHMVARGKQIVATKIVAGYGTREILQTPEEILDFFRSWGIRYALIENHEIIERQSIARAVLWSEQFELVRTFPIWTNIPDAAGRKILVFRYRGPLHRTAHDAVIPMMTLRDDIPANLDRLAGRPWPN